MTDSTQLSIILTTHAKNDHFNRLLEGVLGFSGSRFEVIVIDDAADQVTSQSVEREIRKCENERVFLFTHETRKGRGACLNEALVNASGSLIWAPLRADRLNESLLTEALRRFKADPAAFWVLDYKLPGNPLEWINAVEEGDLPDDSCLIWNRNVIHSEQFFYNPFLDRLHGAELAFRLSSDHVWFTTDPFFVIAGDQSQPGSYSDVQEFLYTALRRSESARERASVLKELSGIESRARSSSADEEFLQEARLFLQQGDANRSLELANKFLKRNPGHNEAIRIKIASLEKLRRHVEALELKHNMKKNRPESAAAPGIDEENTGKPKDTPESNRSADDTGRPAPEGAGDGSLPGAISQDETEPETTPSTDEPPAKEEEPEIGLSVVIPTTGHGKPLLEAALVHLEAATDLRTTELIVIDNASIDDTFEYLEQLRERDFLHLRVITNHANKGFAASVNQGLDAARGSYVLVLHNDVELPETAVASLQRALGHTGDTVLSAPLIDETPVRIQQAGAGEEIRPADRVDSCCFMVKKSLDVRFDEEYNLCFFEMDDFCRQITGQGYEIAVTPETTVRHHRGGTTKMMGVELNPELKWTNRARFYEKWNHKTAKAMPGEGSLPERFRKLGAPDNPLDPDREWVQVVQDYLTSEVRTEILRSEWNEEEFLTIVLTLLIADERELLRTLEDRLEGLQPDKTLLMLFVHYYFKKNIYSRCRHYMDMAEENDPVFDLYRLKILVEEKQYEDAVPLLNRLLEQYPSSPELYHIAGEMYRRYDDQGEAKSFFAMANQLDPFRFKPDDSAFEIRL